ncbi:restriction endonuclease subunit S [Patescibacteria group bacterium]|nr:restriction endonuclease subunit S [Patescibacteria group bacterium]
MITPMQNHYKQTAIGEIPNSWDIKQLQEVADFSNGYAFSSRSFVNSKNDAVPVFKMGNIGIDGGLKITGKEDYASLVIAEKLKNYLTRENDILMCMTDMKSSMNLLGHSARIHNEKFLVNQRVGIIRPRTNVDASYLYYYLNSPKYIERLRTTARSGVQVNLTTEAIRESQVLCPAQEEQHQIAAILSSLDDKIELNRKMNKTLEEMGNALFKRWFVDFEFPDENGKSYKSTGGEMVESELGEIPISWKIVEINDFGKIVCGKTPPKSNHKYFGGNIPFIKIPDMHGRMFVIKTEDTLTSDGADYQKNKTLPKGSICVSCIATVGLVCIITQDSQTNQQINSIIPNNSHYKEYLYFVLSSMTKQLQDFASGGSATLNLNTGSFSNIPMLSPSYDLLAKFHSVAELIFEQVVLKAMENEKLSAIRDSLLPRLMNGKLRVKK